jgi:uncharacterized protein (DUF302 family)
MALDEARARLLAELPRHGFRVLSELGLDHQAARFRLIVAWHPELAQRALAIDPGLGLLAPCHAALWLDDDGAVVSLARPRTPAEATLAPLAETEEKLRAVLLGLNAPEAAHPLRTNAGGAAKHEG